MIGAFAFKTLVFSGLAFFGWSLWMKWLEKNAKPDVYENWQRGMGTLRGRILNAILTALLFQAAWWVWHATVREIDRGARACTNRDFGRPYDVQACWDFEHD